MRSKKAKKRIVLPDPEYKSRVVSRMINVVMLDGKKTTAQKIVYSAIEKLAEDKKDALNLFEQAVKNVMPKQEVRSRRVGGATYQVPMPVKHTRAEALALRWIVWAARKKQGKPMYEFLAQELSDAANEMGSAIRKRDDTHKMAESNRAFAHFKF